MLVMSIEPLRLSEYGKKIVIEKLEQQKLTKVQLSRKTAISRATVSKFVNGHTLSRKAFFILCQALEIKDWESILEKNGDSINIRRVVAGSVITTGNSNVVINENGEVVGRDLTVTRQIEGRVISQNQAFERIGFAVRSNLSQLEHNIIQVRKDSGQFFKLTLIFASLGFLIVLAGVGLLLAGQVAAGVVSSISSIIPEVTAILFFRKDKELRATIERYHQYILDSQRILTMIDIAETVKSERERDSLKRVIIYKVLEIEN